MAGGTINNRQKDISRLMRDRKNVFREKLKAFHTNTRRGYDNKGSRKDIDRDAGKS